MFPVASDESLLRRRIIRRGFSAQFGRAVTCHPVHEIDGSRMGSGQRPRIDHILIQGVCARYRVLGSQKESRARPERSTRWSRLGGRALVHDEGGVVDPNGSVRSDDQRRHLVDRDGLLEAVVGGRDDDCATGAVKRESHVSCGSSRNVNV